MRVTPVGKIVVFLLVVGMAVGGWRLWQSRPGAPRTGGAGGESRGSGTDAGGTTSSGGSPAKPGDILFFYERSAEKWLHQAADAFNRQGDGQQRIVMEYRGSREGKQEILYGKAHPVLWNPADSYWTDK